jgi:hypothetical protein
MSSQMEMMASWTVARDALPRAGWLRQSVLKSAFEGKLTP